MKKSIGIIQSISTILFLSLSSSVESSILTVNFDVRLTNDIRQGLDVGCSSSQVCYFTTTYNQIIPVSMSLEIDKPVVTSGGMYGSFGKPKIESPLPSIWGAPSNYSDWTLSDRSPSTQETSSSLFWKSGISTTYTPKPFYLNSEFHDIQVIKKDDQVKENSASIKLLNEFIDYDLNMSGDELISYLNLAKSAIYNSPFAVSFSSREYTSYIYNGYNYGWADPRKPISSIYLSGEARISSLSISEVPLPPSFILFFSSLIGLGFMSSRRSD